MLIAKHLRKQGVLAKISERVSFARRRFGLYDVIDFLAVLFGYAVSGEHTLEAFYERLHPSRSLPDTFAACQKRKAKRQPVVVFWNGKQHFNEARL